MIAFDIDGVLADVRHRLHHVQSRPKDWVAFFTAAAADAVLPEGLAAVRRAAAQGSFVYMTGRPERYRGLTSRWLRENDFPAATVHMRSDTDRRPGADYKMELLLGLGGPARVTGVYDDDPAVVARLLAAGFTVEHVTWMPVAGPQQQTLFDLQERHGRT